MGALACPAPRPMACTSATAATGDACTVACFPSGGGYCACTMGALECNSFMGGGGGTGVGGGRGMAGGPGSAGAGGARSGAGGGGAGGSTAGASAAGASAAGTAGMSGGTGGA